MARRSTKIPDVLPSWLNKVRAEVIYIPGSKDGDPTYECVGGPLCGSLVVLQGPYSCMVPGTRAGPGEYPGIYVGCRTCCLMFIRYQTRPSSILPCGHLPQDADDQLTA